MIGKFYIYNALHLGANFIEIGRHPSCDLCGESPRIKGLTGEGSATYGNDESSDPGY
jgi:hypothetical protein